MTGVCVDVYVHLVQNTSDLDDIAMRMQGEPIEIVFLTNFVESVGSELQRVRRRAASWLIGTVLYACRKLTVELLMTPRLVENCDASGISFCLVVCLWFANR